MWQMVKRTTLGAMAPEVAKNGKIPNPDPTIRASAKTEVGPAFIIISAAENREKEA